MRRLARSRRLILIGAWASLAAPAYGCGASTSVAPAAVHLDPRSPVTQAPGVIGCDAIEEEVRKVSANPAGGVTVLRLSGPCRRRLRFKNAAHVAIVGHQMDMSGVAGRPFDGCSEFDAICLVDPNDVVLRDFEIANNWTTRRGETAVGIHVRGAGDRLTISGNTVHHSGVAYPAGESRICKTWNAHGILVEGVCGPPGACKGLQNVTITGNQLHDLKLGNSEALTVRCAVPKARVVGNLLQRIDNIGIDIIAGEGGECALLEGAVVAQNVIEVLARGNPTYDADGQGAGGIYVDGASRTTIQENSVSGFDHGIEVGGENRERGGGTLLSCNRTCDNKHEIHLGGMSGSSGTVIRGHEGFRRGTSCPALTTEAFHKDGDCYVAEGNDEGRTVEAKDCSRASLPGGACGPKRAP